MKKWWIVVSGVIIVVALIILLYLKKSQRNPLTGKRQYLNLTPVEEVKLGIQSAPQLAIQFGGLYENKILRDSVKSVGDRLLKMISLDLNPYKFDFHLLADQKNCNAFALPGGQIFITAGLLKQLKSVDQLAAVLSHEMGHVAGRHAAEKMATNGLLKGLIGSGRSERMDYPEAETAAYVAEVINLTYNQDEEMECDDFAVRFMRDAGYNPQALLESLEILSRASGPFDKSHPKDERRILKLAEATQKYRQH